MIAVLVVLGILFAGVGGGLARKVVGCLLRIVIVVFVIVGLAGLYVWGKYLQH